jgi:hypothetical protein
MATASKTSLWVVIGYAALAAILAALGIAYQRRFAEQTESN